MGQAVTGVGTPGNRRFGEDYVYNIVVPAGYSFATGSVRLALTAPFEGKYVASLLRRFNNGTTVAVASKEMPLLVSSAGVD